MLRGNRDSALADRAVHKVAPAGLAVATSIVMLNSVLDLVQEARAENPAAALAQMTAASSKRAHNGWVAAFQKACACRSDLVAIAEIEWTNPWIPLCR